MHVVVARIGVAAAEGRVKGVRRLAACIGVPLGHRQHTADAGFANGRRGAQRVAVEGVQPCVGPPVRPGPHQQRQVVAPVAGEHGLCAAGLDLAGIGHEVLDAPHGVQFVAHDAHVRPALAGQQGARMACHVLAEAVVLADQVDAAQRALSPHRARPARSSRRCRCTAPAAGSAPAPAAGAPASSWRAALGFAPTPPATTSRRRPVAFSALQRLGHQHVDDGRLRAGGQIGRCARRGDGPSLRCWVSTAVFRPANEKSRSPLCSSGRGSAKAPGPAELASRASAGPPG
jgi:hypothetical protein